MLRFCGKTSPKTSYLSKVSQGALSPVFHLGGTWKHVRPGAFFVLPLRKHEERENTHTQTQLTWWEENIRALWGLLGYQSIYLMA